MTFISGLFLVISVICFLGGIGALFNPQTVSKNGKEPPSKKSVFFSGIFASLLFLAFSFATSPDKDDNKSEKLTNAARPPPDKSSMIASAAPTNGATSEVKVIPPILAESIVSFPQSGFACITPDLLEEALLHLSRGEKTKFEYLITDESNGVSACFMLRNDIRWKVLSVSYPHESTTGLIEISLPKSKSPHGVWTISTIAKLLN